MPRTHDPLTPAVLHILLALAEPGAPRGGQGKHGYAVAQEVEALTDGTIRMGPGTLYGTLQRLLGAAFVEEAEGDGEDERRRYYRLTALGGRVLAAELRRLRALLESPAARTAVRGWAT